MLSFDTNTLKTKKLHKFMGRLSAFCWWAAILMFLIHMGFCFEKSEVSYDVMYPDSLVKNPTIIIAIAFIYWVLLSVVYFLFGRSILKNNLKQMVILAVLAIVIPLIRFILLRGNAVNGVWDIACWIIVLQWIGWNKWIHKNDAGYLSEAIFFLIGIICVFIRSYYGSAEIYTFADFLGIYSFVFQDMFRSFAMIFLGLWLLTMPKENVA